MKLVASTKAGPVPESLGPDGPILGPDQSGPNQRHNPACWKVSSKAVEIFIRKKSNLTEEEENSVILFR